jgi:hypothetical protein
MIQIQLNSIKEFMNQLLRLDHFDDYSCVLGEITTYNTFTIDGFIHKEYYSHPKDESTSQPVDTHRYSRWAELKELSYSLIKGQRLPLCFKFVLLLPNNDIDSFITKYNLECTATEIQGLHINIRYENQSLYATTGTILKTFSLSKDIERAWDAEFIVIMDALAMNYEIL